MFKDISVIHIGGDNINFKGINDINLKRIPEDIIKLERNVQISNDKIGRSFFM